MKIITSIIFIVCSFALTSTITAQQINCYTKGEFKHSYKAPNTDASYDFSIEFCKTAVSRFATTHDSDKVVLLTIVKNTKEKKAIGTYQAIYKIVSVQEDKDTKDLFLFVADLVRATKAEIVTPDLLNLNKLTMYQSYERETFSLLLQDKTGKYFFRTAEIVDYDGYGW